MIAQVKDNGGTKTLEQISGSTPTGNPVGTLLSRANGQVPRNYLECDGSTFNEGQYPALYLYLGTNVLPERFDHSQPSAIETIVPSTTTITEVTALYDGILWLLSDSTISGRKVTINGVQYNPLSTSAMSNVTISVRKGDVVSISGSTSTNNYIVQAFWFKKHLYIKAVDGVDISDEDTFLDTVKNFVQEKNSYSTTEMLTGGKWIDGKPIYRRVFTGILNSNTFTITVPNLSEIATQVRIDGFIKTPEPYYFTVNSSTPVRTFFSPVIHQGILIQSSGVASNNTEYTVVFEYTKTTD